MPYVVKLKLYQYPKLNAHCYAREEHNFFSNSLGFTNYTQTCSRCEALDISVQIW